MDLIEIAKNNWLLLLIGVLVLVLLVRAMFQLALFVAIAGAVLIFVFDYTPAQVLLLGKDVASETTKLYEATIQPILEKELDNAVYAVYPDGHFTIRTKSIEIEGTQKSEQVTVRMHGKEYILPIAALGKEAQTYIEIAQSENVPTN